MKLFKSWFAALLILVSLTGCATGDLSDWPTRYKAEITALTQAYTAAAVSITAGAVTKEKALKVLEETDRLSAQLKLAWVFRPAVEGSAELVKARDDARALLVATLGQ